MYIEFFFRRELNHFYIVRYFLEIVGRWVVCGQLGIKATPNGVKDQLLLGLWGQCLEYGVTGS